MGCGQCGFVFIGTRLRPWKDISDTFALLLRVNEERGPYATGLAVIRTDGERRVLKQPIRARQFLEAPEVRNVLRKLDDDIDVLMGHTRWPTGGSVLDSRNNHPITTAIITGTHNGWVRNADDLFDKWGLERTADVDSEVIFRLADESMRRGDIDYYLERIHECDGPVTAVWHSKQNGKVYITRIGASPKPLEAAYSNTLGVLAYSSVYLMDCIATSDIAGVDWTPLEIEPGTWEVSPQDGTVTFLAP
jgi:amidophosphoribosyltransferase